ncbi:MAG: hypothetical protein WAK53_13435 [Chromatiaceae bacterium]|jgi:hypothetical protein
MNGQTGWGAAFFWCLVLLTGGLLAPAAQAAVPGDLLWARSAGGAGGFEASVGIAADAAGNSLSTGYFTDSATFGSGEANETTLTAAGGEFDIDIFVAKYGPNGTLLWARSAGGGDNDRGYSIGVDPAGNALATGEFGGSATFGYGEPNETILASAGSWDIFIVQYAPEGTLRWARSAGGLGQDQGRGIVVDAAGKALVTGFFDNSATFGAVETSETTLTAVGSSDTFIAKYAGSADAVADKVGIWRPSDRTFYLEANGNGAWDGTSGGDLATPFGVSTDIPVRGDWSGNGVDTVGVRRGSDRTFYLDANGNGAWDGPVGGDLMIGPFGIATDIPVMGDWNGAGVDTVGVWRASDRRFYLDANGNGVWDGLAGGRSHNRPLRALDGCPDDGRLER